MKFLDLLKILDTHKRIRVWDKDTEVIIFEGLVGEVPWSLTEWKLTSQGAPALSCDIDNDEQPYFSVLIEEEEY